jgi:NDP-sugar pyrophosphorylase family protein
MSINLNPQVVILAGGLGTRLGELTQETPKPMIMVKGKPFLEWQLEFIKEQGLKKILLLTGYRGDKIKEYFGDGKSRGLDIEYSMEKEPLGTGGALLNAKHLLEIEFLLMFGDSFLPVDYKKMVAQLDLTSDAVMAVYDNREDTDVPFNVALDGKSKVEVYYKKGLSSGEPSKPLKFVEAGVYFVRKNLLAGLQVHFCSFENELLKLSLRSHKVKGWLSPQRFFDIGTPERLSYFERRVSDYFPNAL